jgi:hypothetical protein
LVGESEETRNSEDNIKIDVREVQWGGVVWINVVQGRDQRRSVLSRIVNIRVQ